MITYTVSYRRPDEKKFNEINNVKGDGILESNTHRFFILEDETRIELPITYEFIFSKERFFSIEKRMSMEAGQPIQLRKG